MMIHRQALATMFVGGLMALPGCGGGESGTMAATQADSSGGNGVCLQSFLISHTSIPDDSTILYHMKDGKIWKNSLPFACPSLRNEGGFTYTSDAAEICSKLITIRVLRSGIFCEMGQFTPYTPPTADSGAGAPERPKSP